MRLRDLLELIRVPNVFTTPADVAMGLAVGGTAVTTRAIPIFAASMLAYAGGMALNDACDAALDAVERPRRPIPSGRISRGGAFLVAALLLGGSLALATFAGWRVLLVDTALVATIIAYDALGKRTRFGPLLMASCRGLDAGLGLALGVVSSASLTPLTLLFLYVLALTVISRFEVKDAPLMAVLGIGVAMVAVLATSAGFTVGRGTVWALPFLGGLAVLLGRPFRDAFREPLPPRVIAIVKTCVLGIILLDAAFVAASAGVVTALAVTLLLIPAMLLGRAFASA